jgi:hypothetical protein
MVQLLCWLSLVAVVCVAWKRIRHPASPHSGPFASPLRHELWRLEAGLAAVALVAYAAALQIPLQKRGAIARAEAEISLRATRARDYLELSRRLYLLGRYADSTAAAHESAKE